MEIYHGTALSPGVAIASAARLTDTYGIVQLAPERLRRIGEFMQKAGLDLPEPDQVILLASSFPVSALGMATPGLEIIGMALETDAPSNAAIPYPAVSLTGGDLLTQTEEGEIVIVDGDRGRVYVSPDAQTLARYQGPTRKSKRVFLEPAHIPARRASTGVSVPVLAVAGDMDSVQRAVDAGADGILVPDGGALWAPDEFLTASEQLARLQSIMDMTSGKVLIISVPMERVALSALARVAATGPVHLTLRSASSAAEARDELDGLEVELEADDALYGRVALEANISADEALTSDTLSHLRGVVTASIETISPELLSAGIDITALLDVKDGHDEVTRWLDAGATRFVTVPEHVQNIKEAVRVS